MTAEIALFDVEPVVQRLRAACPLLRLVGGAADLAAVAQPGGVRASPSAFVLLSGAAPHEVKEGSGPLRQDLTVTFSVLLGVTLAGAQGAAGLKAIEAPAKQVRGALFGWAPPEPAYRRCWSAGEALEDFDAKTGVLLYRLDFETEVHIQET